MRTLLLALATAMVLAAPGLAAPTPSGLAQALSAAFQESLAQGVYDAVYTKHVGIPPRFAPEATAAEWPARVVGTPLDRALRRGVLRLGFSDNAPHHYRDDSGAHVGLDVDLAADMVRRIGAHYGVPGLSVQWVEEEADPDGDAQREIGDALIAGLKRGEFDAGISVGDPVSLGDRAKFRGLDLGLPASGDLLAMAPFTLPGGYSTSELSEVLSAAFREFAAQPDSYADLSERYLGVRREAPSVGSAGRWIAAAEATPGSTLDRVLASGRIRFGFRRAAPYCFTGEDGRMTGFEFELGNALVEIMRRRYPGLQAEWIEQPFASDGSGLENYLLYESLEPALLRGDFDVALSGLIRCPDRPVGVAAADLELYCTAVYTGRDGWDASSLVGASRDDLVRYLAARPGATIVSTAGGPSQEEAEALVADVQAAGGTVTSRLATPAELVGSLGNQADHFILGDALALSAATRKPGFPGVVTGIALRGGDFLAPVTALDPSWFPPRPWGCGGAGACWRRPR